MTSVKLQDRRNARSDQGIALVTALMLLSMMTLIGGALLSSTTVDTRISDNYRTNTQLIFLAEAGIEDARESLRLAVEAKITASAVDAIVTLSDGITAVLQDFDGADGAMATSVDPTVLLNTGVTDDVRYRDAVALVAGGQTIGTYTVFIRNDVADGAAANTDTNEILTMISIGEIGNAMEVVEVDLKKGRFPDIPSAVTLNGPVPPNGYITPNSANFHINGDDEAGVAPPVNSMGVLDLVPSGDNVEAEITAGADYSDQYCGELAPPDAFGDCAGTGPDIDDVSGDLSAEVNSAAGLLSTMTGIEISATHRTCPTNPWGSAAAPRVTYVDGNCSVPNNVDGWGLLAIRGTFTMGGNGTWNGLIIVVDDTPCNPLGAGGTPHYAAEIAGTSSVNGGVFVASVIGGVLSDACLNFNGGGSSGGVEYNSENIRNAGAALPFYPVAWRRYQ